MHLILIYAFVDVLLTCTTAVHLLLSCPDQMGRTKKDQSTAKLLSHQAVGGTLGLPVLFIHIIDFVSCLRTLFDCTPSSYHLHSMICIQNDSLNTQGALSSLPL